MAGVQSTLQLNDRMTPVLRSIMKALDATLKAMAEVDKISKKSFDKATDAVVRANRALDQFGSSATRAGVAGSSSQRKFKKDVDESSRAVEGLIEKAKTLLATYVAFEGAKLLVQRSDAYVGTQASLDLMLRMTESQKTSAELQQQIYEASQRSLSNYRDMAKTVAKLGLLAGEAFGNTDEMVQFTELLNKQFSLVKATPWEKSAAMYQLTQAMASGRLQGDEFRSIIENAPMLAQTIQDYMGLTGQAFKEASRDGKITADIIKNALFSVAKETNEAFAKMPLSFGELWVQVLNKLDRGLEGIYSKLGQVWNSKKFQKMLDLAVNGLIGLSYIAIGAMEAFGNIGSWLYDNWEQIVPLLIGAATAFGFFLTTQLLGYGRLVAMKLWKIGIDWMETAAILALYAAQNGLNVAMAMCPLSWFVYGLIAIVAIVYVIIAAINKMAGTTYSATGIIVGVISVAIATIWNLIYGLGEFIWGIVQLLWNGIAGFANFLGNVMDNPVSSWIYLFRDVGMQILNIIGAIASAIDAVFGSELSKGVNKWKKGLNIMAEAAVQVYAKDENYEKKMNQLNGSLQEMGIGGRIGYNVAWDTGYDWGKTGMDSIKDAFSIGDKTFNQGMMNPAWVPMDQLNSNVNGINENTGDTANALKDGVNLSDEDVSLLKEYARVQFVNKMTSLTPKVNATFGDVRESADVNVILQLIEKLVRDASDSDLT